MEVVSPQLIKQRAMGYINLFRTVVGLDKAKQCAIIHVQGLRASWEKYFIPSSFNPVDADMEYQYYTEIFDKIEKAIRAY